MSPFTNKRVQVTTEKFERNIWNSLDACYLSWPRRLPRPFKRFRQFNMFFHVGLPNSWNLHLGLIRDPQNQTNRRYKVTHHHFPFKHCYFGVFSHVLRHLLLRSWSTWSRWNFIGTATWPTGPWRMLAWWQTGGTWNRPGKSWMQPALRWEHLHWWSMGIPFAWACWVICRRGSKKTHLKKNGHVWTMDQEFLEVQTWYNHVQPNSCFLHDFLGSQLMKRMSHRREMPSRTAWEICSIAMTTSRRVPRKWRWFKACMPSNGPPMVRTPACTPMQWWRSIVQPSRWVLLSTFAEHQRLVKRGALCRLCVHSLRANLCSGSSCSQADLCEDTKGVEGKMCWEVDDAGIYIY